MQEEDMLPAPTSVQGCRLILQGVKKLGHHISVANLSMSGLQTLALSITATRGLNSNQEWTALDFLGLCLDSSVSFAWTCRKNAKVLATPSRWKNTSKGKWHRQP